MPPTSYYPEGSYKKTVGHRRDSFDGACCHREASLDDVTGELVLFQCPHPQTFGWVGIFCWSCCGTSLERRLH